MQWKAYLFFFDIFYTMLTIGEFMAVTRIDVLGVGIDILHEEDWNETIMNIVSKPGTKQIVFLSVWDLLKARHKGDFQNCIKNADLVIPISKSILAGASFLKRQIPIRYNPFDTVINVMSVLDAHFKSIYLLGSRPQTLHIAERNVADTFPNLRIVGRYPGYYHKTKEKDVIQAIFKASPSLVLVGDGIKDKICWAYKRRNQFSSSIFLFYKDVMGIFSKRVKRIDAKTFEKGHEIFNEILHNPLKIFLLFSFIWYLICLLFYRLRGK